MNGASTNASTSTSAAGGRKSGSSPPLPFHAGTVVDIHIHPQNNKNIVVVVAAAVVAVVVVAVVVVVIVVFDSELHNM